MSAKVLALYRRILLAGFVMCLLFCSTNLRAQECQIDTAGLANVPVSGEELRAFMIKKTELILCTAATIGDNKSRVSFPAKNS